MPKVFSCSACGGQHKRPVGQKCQMGKLDSSTATPSGVEQQGVDEGVNQEIINALSSVSSRLWAIEARIERTEQQIQGGLPATSQGVQATVGSALNSMSSSDDSDAEDDAIIPSAKFLKGSKNIQQAIGSRLLELAALNEQGKFKLQRGGKDQVTVKQQVPWPQNYVLAGTAKTRTTYDSLSIFQWIPGMCAIIRKEKQIQVRNAMLEYVSNIMEDTQDFGWASAKGAHALILCKMEEGKVDWSMTEKIDRLRRAHAQKIVANPSTVQGRKNGEMQGVPCRYFQTGKCTHKADHLTAGQLYKHICNFCNNSGKQLNHPLRDCRNAKKKNESAKNE